MANAYRTIRQGLLQAAVMLCTVSPAIASINSAEPAPASVQIPDVAQEPPKPNIGWLEQPVQSVQDAVTDGASASLATPPALVANHATHIGRQREDMDLTANDSAIARYNLKDDEPIFSEHWWQALPGIAVAVFLGLAMYMRHPIQRKRKYRSTPHEPYGGYKRRSR